MSMHLWRKAIRPFSGRRRSTSLGPDACHPDMPTAYMGNMTKRSILTDFVWIIATNQDLLTRAELTVAGAAAFAWDYSRSNASDSGNGLFNQGIRRRLDARFKLPDAFPRWVEANLPSEDRDALRDILQGVAARLDQEKVACDAISGGEVWIARGDFMRAYNINERRFPSTFMAFGQTFIDLNIDPSSARPLAELMGPKYNEVFERYFASICRGVKDPEFYSLTKAHEETKVVWLYPSRHGFLQVERPEIPAVR